MQTQFVKSTAGGKELAAPTDVDGASVSSGGLVTRAFIQGSSYYLWVNNDSNTAYVNQKVAAKASTVVLSGPSCTVWTSDSSGNLTDRTGNSAYACTVSSGQINIAQLPAKSMALIRFQASG